jgi:hypothetical protein
MGDRIIPDQIGFGSFLFRETNHEVRYTPEESSPWVLGDTPVKLRTLYRARGGQYIFGDVSVIVTKLDSEVFTSGTIPTFLYQPETGATLDLTNYFTRIDGVIYSIISGFGSISGNLYIPDETVAYGTTSVTIRCSNDTLPQFFADQTFDVEFAPAEMTLVAWMLTSSSLTTNVFGDSYIPFTAPTTDVGGWLPGGGTNSTFFTVPAGVTTIEALVRCYTTAGTNTGIDFRLTFRKNGVDTHKFMYYNNEKGQSFDLAMIMEVNPGDTISLWAYIYGSSALTLGAYQLSIVGYTS